MEKHRLQAPKRVEKRVASAIKKTHLHTVSGEDKHVIVSLSQGAVTRRGDLMDPIQVCSIYIILRLRDGHLSSLEAFPESLIRRKSSKKTNSIFILLPVQTGEQTTKEGGGFLVDVSCSRWGF